MQVLGLTNYSHDPQADQLRACLIEDPAAQRIGVDFAKERLKGMMHVGVYERLKDSLSGLAHALGRTASSPTWKSETKHAFSYDDDDGDGLADGLDPVCFTSHWTVACRLHSLGTTAALRRCSAIGTALKWSREWQLHRAACVCEQEHGTSQLQARRSCI